eukprot:362110-Chlamydomonas_euryale.AAC.2
MPRTQQQVEARTTSCASSLGGALSHSVKMLRVLPCAILAASRGTPCSSASAIASAACICGVRGRARVRGGGRARPRQERARRECKQDVHEATCSAVARTFRDQLRDPPAASRAKLSAQLTAARKVDTMRTSPTHAAKVEAHPSQSDPAQEGSTSPPAPQTPPAFPSGRQDARVPCLTCVASPEPFSSSAASITSMRARGRHIPCFRSSASAPASSSRMRRTPCACTSASAASPSRSSASRDAHAASPVAASEEPDPFDRDDDDNVDEPTRLQLLLGGEESAAAAPAGGDALAISAMPAPVAGVAPASTCSNSGRAAARAHAMARSPGATGAAASAASSRPLASLRLVPLADSSCSSAEASCPVSPDSMAFCPAAECAAKVMQLRAGAMGWCASAAPSAPAAGAAAPLSARTAAPLHGICSTLPPPCCCLSGHGDGDGRGGADPQPSGGSSSSASEASPAAARAAAKRRCTSCAYFRAVLGGRAAAAAVPVAGAVFRLGVRLERCKHIRKAHAAVHAYHVRRRAHERPRQQLQRRTGEGVSAALPRQRSQKVGRHAVERAAGRRVPRNRAQHRQADAQRARRQHSGRLRLSRSRRERPVAQPQRLPAPVVAVAGTAAPRRFGGHQRRGAASVVLLRASRRARVAQGQRRRRMRRAGCCQTPGRPARAGEPLAELSQRPSQRLQYGRAAGALEVALARWVRP